MQVVLRVLSLHRWAFLVPFSIVSSVGFVMSLYMPRTYTATTSFERRNHPVMDNLPPSAEASFRRFRATMTRDLLSDDCMNDIVEKIELTADLPRQEDGSLTKAGLSQRAAWGRSLRRCLHIQTDSPSPEMDIVKITYTGPDPTVGRKLVDQVKTTAIDQTTLWMRDYLESQRLYYADEEVDGLEELNRARREEIRVRLENPHINPQDPGAISMKLEQLALERRELLLRRGEYEAELSSLQQMMAAIMPPPRAGRPRDGAGDAAAPAIYRSVKTLRLETELAGIEKAIRELQVARGMTVQHPEIQRMLADLEQVEARYQHQLAIDSHKVVTNGPIEMSHLADVVPDVAGQPWRSERAMMLVQIGTQIAKIKDIDILLQSNDSANEQQQQAKRDVFQKQEEFAAASEAVVNAGRKHSKTVDTLATINPAIKALDRDVLVRFSRGQPASGGVIPVSPNATSILLLTLLAGAGVGAAFVVLAELLDRVYRSSAQVARSVGLPILESIDEIITTKDRRRLFLQHFLVAPVVLFACMSVTGITGSMAYLSLRKPQTYERLRQIPEAAAGIFVHEVQPSAAADGDKTMPRTVVPTPDDPSLPLTAETLGAAVVWVGQEPG